MTNRVVFRTVGLFTCIESYPSAHTTRDEPRGGGSRVRSFATFLGQPLTSARRRGTRAQRRQRRRLSRRRRTPPKKSVLFSLFSALRRDRSPRASRRYRSSGGAVGKRRVDRLSRPARAARRERRRAARGPRARRSSRRASAPRCSREDAGDPSAGEEATSARARSTGREGTHPDSGGHSRHNVRSSRRISVVVVASARAPSVPETSLGRSFVSGAHANAFRPEEAEANKTPPPVPSAARLRATAHTHPGSRRASNVHTGDVMTRGRREGRARDSAGRPLVVVWRSFLNRTGRDTSAVAIFRSRGRSKSRRRAHPRARETDFPSPSSRVTSAAAAGRARSARTSALDPTPA